MITDHLVLRFPEELRWWCEERRKRSKVKRVQGFSKTLGFLFTNIIHPCTSLFLHVISSLPFSLFPPNSSNSLLIFQPPNPDCVCLLLSFIFLPPSHPSWDPSIWLPSLLHLLFPVLWYTQKTTKHLLVLLRRILLNFSLLHAKPRLPQSPFDVIESWIVVSSSRVSFSLSCPSLLETPFFFLCQFPLLFLFPDVRRERETDGWYF